MTDPKMAAALRRTYDRSLTAFRPQPDGSEETVWVDIPCALSRAAKISAPTPPQSRALAEARYDLTLYTPPEDWLRLGDRLVISDRTGRIYHARAADSMCYPSHCVTVVRVDEVEVLEADSRETCPEE